MKKLITIMTLVLALVTVVIAGKLVQRVWGSNIKRGKPDYTIYIPTGSTYEDVLSIFKKEDLLKDVESFDWVARKMNYPNHVYPGRYVLDRRMNNRRLVKLLRSGIQTPLMVTLNKFRTKVDLAGYISTKIETDSLALMELLGDRGFLAEYELTPDNVMAVFLPDTYEFFWTTDAREFFNRMYKEYKRYWDGTRKEKALKEGLDPLEVTILASIVEEETNVFDERPTIAGVYLNRLDRHMKLQADPTVKFALQDFGLKRILTIHTEFKSPYNTYVVDGLPPGPICTPSKNAIEAVLNAEDHDYLYFCAKDDFSGAHVFSKTHREHINNAKRFHQALSRNGIR